MPMVCYWTNGNKAPRRRSDQCENRKSAMFIRSKKGSKEIVIHVAQAYPPKTPPSSLNNVCPLSYLVALSLDNGLGETSAKI